MTVHGLVNGCSGLGPAPPAGRLFSCGQLLAGFRCELRRCRWLSARPPTSAEAREFGIKRGSPVLVARSRRFDDAGQVIEYAELIARADTRVEYRYEYLPHRSRRPAPGA